ncbi:TRAP transporter small permease [Falsihalocynthiibacter sp. CO-5D18]|uniref:TRAP transporter small permease n=1 Tax=Falsihalocynthiibacter sp. CO-5D18 TaxID=3240872 RepID=UPI003510947B
MRSFGLWIRRIENLISLSALALLAMTVLWGVMTRYITERPAVWTTELSGILFTWVVFIGAMTAFREGKHIRVTLFIDILPDALQKILLKAGDFIVLGFLVYVTYLSFLMMLNGASRPSPVLNIPFSMVYLATVICFASMTATSMLRLSGFLPPPENAPLEEVL